METRKGWGMVVVAVVFALAAIGVAGGTYIFENMGGKGPSLQASGAKSPTDEDGDGLLTWEEVVWKTDRMNPDSDADGISDGAEVSAGTDPLSSEAESLAIANQSQTVSFVESVAAAESYIGSRQLDPGEEDAIRLAAVESSVKIPTVHGAVPASALTIGTSNSLSEYTQLVFLVLRQSTNIRESELATFRKVMETKNYSGSPELKETALLYKKIAAALLAIEVSNDLAKEHLALINATDGLANTVNLMAGWNGDSVQSLVYINLLAQEQAAVEASAQRLFAKISSLF
jgi:hypothetical protein